MSSPSPKKDIVVVGGSLAGLFTGIPLLRQGHNVTILERSPTPLLHDQGAGIVTGTSTAEFFRRFDRSGRGTEGLKGGLSVRSQERLYLDQKGNVIDGEGWEQRMTSWDLLYYLSRFNFDGRRTAYVPEGAEGSQEGEGRGVYEYGRSATVLQDLGEKVKVEFDDVREGSAGGSGSLEADFVIIADGPSSHLRKQLVPEAKVRTYAGYVAFRGTVPEQELSQAATDVFVERFTFYHGSSTQILAYTIPGPESSLESGKRLVNWVWYWNLADGSEELRNVMTDTDGNTHRWTLPTGGKMQPRVWEKQKDTATAALPPQFAELVHKTKKPFVQAIADLPPSPQPRLLGGKALLVGDSLAAFRPHTAGSTGQAALHALLLDQAFKGEVSWDFYEQNVMNHAISWQQRGVVLGNRSQFGSHPFAEASTEDARRVDRKDLWMRQSGQGSRE
ncbi:FAD/NAD(P)-binding domain-containing protein [Rhizodiscina lignyota]|uniref:FAD/NAD(P)-binding domain-containing protein n=1 Tax=Rhizodiscina lignyota TaxID=1504668 RepID=A0A9P4IB28_9PEZI|nr:FAD/NAD(P)-binding domain-containing protein [Rhizodiscina lignyota]